MSSIDWHRCLCLIPLHHVFILLSHLIHPFVRCCCSIWIKTRQRGIKQRHLPESIELIKLYPSTYRLLIVHRHTYMHDDGWQQQRMNGWTLVYVMHYHPPICWWIQFVKLYWLVYVSPSNSSPSCFYSYCNAISFISSIVAVTLIMHACVFMHYHQPICWWIQFVELYWLV